MRFKIFCQSMHGSLLLLHTVVICVMSQISKFCFVFLIFSTFCLLCCLLVKNPRRSTSLMNRQSVCLILRCYFITEYYNCFRLRAFPYCVSCFYTVSLTSFYGFAFIYRCFIVILCICPCSISNPVTSTLQL